MWLSCGYRLIRVYDEIQKTNLAVVFLYPALAEERTERFGPYSIDVAKDAGIAATGLSLIVFSHGNGGTPWAYRDMAKHLARSGYVVALPEHAAIVVTTIAWRIPRQILRIVLATSH
jgi:predicted dienelactone hydrolase